MKSFKHLFFLSFMLIIFSCDNDDPVICEGFSLASCDITDEMELAIMHATLQHQASSFFDIQLSQRTRSTTFVGTYGWTLEQCGFELDSVALQQFTVLNSTAHFWCTDFIDFDNIISREELDCLYSSGFNEYNMKYPDTKVYTFTRPVVDRFGRAYITFDDGCATSDVVLELVQGSWQVVCSQPSSIC